MALQIFMDDAVELLKGRREGRMKPHSKSLAVGQNPGMRVDRLPRPVRNLPTAQQSALASK